MNTAMEFRSELESRRRELNAWLDRFHQARCSTPAFESAERSIHQRLEVTADALYCCGSCPVVNCDACVFRTEVRRLLTDPSAATVSPRLDARWPHHG